MFIGLEDVIDVVWVHYVDISRSVDYILVPIGFFSDMRFVLFDYIMAQ